MTDPNSSIGSTSSSLLERVRAQDQDAWRRLVRLYGPLVDYWLSRAGLQAADTEDIFQEVFRAVATNIATFRKDRPTDSFRGWLRTITRSKVADHYRRLGSQPAAIGGSDAQLQLLELAEPPEPDSQEATEAEALRLRAMELIRSEFEERTWQAFWRVTVEGHPVQDVARDLGVTPGAIRVAKYRVLHRLRAELRDLEP